MDGKIGHLTNLKKQTFTLEIERRWVMDIIEDGERKNCLDDEWDKDEARVVIYLLILPLIHCHETYVPYNHLT